MEGHGPFIVVSWRPLPTTLSVKALQTEAKLTRFQYLALLESAQIRKQDPARLGGWSLWPTESRTTAVLGGQIHTS